MGSKDEVDVDSSFPCTLIPRTFQNEYIVICLETWCCVNGIIFPSANSFT